MAPRHRDAKSGVTTGLILILVGLFFLLDRLGYMDLSDFIRTFWPLLLVFWGLKMVLFPRRRHDAADEQRFFGDESKTGSKETTTENSSSESRTFGDLRRRIVSTHFQGGRYSITFGELDLDISEIGLATGEQTLHLNATFGSILLVLPKRVPCMLQANCTLGDIRIRDLNDDGLFVQRTWKSDDYDTAGTRLKIVASVTIGELKGW